MEKINVSAAQVGVMFAVSGIVGAFVQGFVIRKWVKHGQEEKFILLGLFTSSLGFFLILFSFDFWSATAFVAVFGAGNALIRPCVTSLITQKTTVGQGVASGLISSMDSLGRMSGPLIGTILYQIHIELPFIFGALFTFASIFLLYGFLRHMRTAS
jgi:MFS family permease